MDIIQNKMLNPTHQVSYDSSEVIKSNPNKGQTAMADGQGSDSLLDLIVSRLETPSPRQTRMSDRDIQILYWCVIYRVNRYEGSPVSRGIRLPDLSYKQKIALMRYMDTNRTIRGTGAYNLGLKAVLANNLSISGPDKTFAYNSSRHSPQRREDSSED
jgi:hypothetical protein